MKFSFSIAALLLAATPAFSSPIAAVAVNGVLPGTPPKAKRDVGPHHPVIEARATTTLKMVCNADNVLRDLRNPTDSVAASSFCSTFLQSTLTTTVTTIVPDITTVPVTETTVVTSTIIVVNDIPSTTILCAASPTSTITTCNYLAYGYAEYLITQTPFTDPITCHEMCLSNPNCQSFQVENGGSSYCNLYNVPTYNNVLPAPGDIFTIFDRDCTQYLPAGCSSSAPKEKRAVPIPSYIPATVPYSRISSACSCFITAPDAPATTTVVVPQTSVSTALATIVVTVLTVVTNNVDSTTGFAIVTAAP